jgi:hypothetical protein
MHDLVRLYAKQLPDQHCETDRALTLLLQRFAPAPYAALSSSHSASQPPQRRQPRPARTPEAISAVLPYRRRVRPTMTPLRRDGSAPMTRWLAVRELLPRASLRRASPQSECMLRPSDLRNTVWPPDGSGRFGPAAPR